MQCGDRRIGLVGRQRWRRTCPRSRRTAGRCRACRRRRAPAACTGSLSSSRMSANGESLTSSLATVPTPPRVASRIHRVDGAAASSDLDEFVHGRGVGGDVGVDGQVAAGQHDGHPVLADRPGQHHLVAGLHEAAGQLPAFGDHADACGGDVHTVGRALADDLRVAGDDLHTRLRRGFAHVGDDFAEFGDREALLDDERRRQPLRPRARHREVVDRSVHGDMADGSARKAPRRNDNESVENASRSPEAVRSAAASPSCSSSSLRNASRNTASTSAADDLPPAPCASVTTSSSSRGRRCRNLSIRSSTRSSRSAVVLMRGHLTADGPCAPGSPTTAGIRASRGSPVCGGCSASAP